MLLYLSIGIAYGITHIYTQSNTDKFKSGLTDLSDASNMPLLATFLLAILACFALLIHTILWPVTVMRHVMCKR